MSTSRAKHRINSLLPTGRQVFSHLQESRAPPHVMATQEEKHHHSKCAPLPASSPSLYGEHGTSPHPAGVNCLNSVPSRLLLQPRSTRWQGRVREQQRPRLCVSNHRKPPCVISILVAANPKHSTTQATVKRINFTQPNPAEESSFFLLSYYSAYFISKYFLVAPAHVELSLSTLSLQLR